MNKYLDIKSPAFKILLIFLSWRIILIIVSIFAVNNIPLGYKDRFLGGGAVNYHLYPEFFGWANFDGEHYLSIAIFGYKYLEQAFFPLYPKLISLLIQPNHFNLLQSQINGVITGLIISNTSFILALMFLWKLIRIDYSIKTAYMTIILLLIFPTSFYFGSVYNEALFLLLSVLSFYFARKGNWFLAGVFGALSSATRVFGILLLPALIFEAWQQKVRPVKALWVLLIPFGIGSYMWYLNYSVGDPIAFYTYQKLVGEQRQSGITLLPQVYFRYFKMLATTSFHNPIFQTILLELITGIIFFLLPIYGYFKKIRISYLFFAMLGFLIPTIQGSFSSTPRYILILFPSFLIAALWLNNRSTLFKALFFILSIFGLIIETTLFIRGYWVA